MKRTEFNERKENFLKDFNNLLDSYKDIVYFEKDEQYDTWYKDDEYHDFIPVVFRNIKTEEDIAEENK